jgi:molecular chaperone IbpA
MRTFDLSPLFRSTVGFDRLSRLMDAAARVDESALAYPPYNIERTGDDTYRITMAVAGFGEGDLNVVTQDNQLLISGKNAKDEAENSFLYRGIAGRAFERRFTLADHIRVSGASLVNGLLHVELVREVPEAMKPRQVKITGASAKSQPTIENKAA